MNTSRSESKLGEASRWELNTTGGLLAMGAPGGAEQLAVEAHRGGAVQQRGAGGETPALDALG